MNIIINGAEYLSILDAAGSDYNELTGIISSFIERVYRQVVEGIGWYPSMDGIGRILLARRLDGRHMAPFVNDQFVRWIDNERDLVCDTYDIRSPMQRSLVFGVLARYMGDVANEYTPHVFTQ
jgi:hypothetical protein